MSIPETEFIQGKIPGWYEGWWTGPDGVPGGWIFYPLFFGYRGDGEKPTEITRDLPRRVLKYWDGEKIHNDRPRE